MRKFYLLLSLLLIASCATINAQEAKSEIKITTSKVYGSGINLWPKSTSKADTIFIDWGNGEIEKYNIDPKKSPYFTKVSGKVLGDTIRIFTQLVKFDCAGQEISSLAAINQPKLTDLLAGENKLTSESFYLEKTPNISNLDLSQNDFAVLDIRNLTNLEMFNISTNARLSTVLFADGAQHLRSISMDDCDISHFYPINLPALESLNLSNGALMELEVGANYPKLQHLNISGNYFSAIDVTKCPSLFSLSCTNNNLTEINVTQNPELVELYCSNNKIADLNLYNNPKLSSIGCDNNLLTSLDVSQLPVLTKIECSNNNITRIDLTHNFYLRRFVSKDTKLEFLDFAGNPRMDYIDIRNNSTMTACTINYMFATLLGRYTDPFVPNLLIEGCNAEHSNTAEMNTTEMKWKTDVKGDGTATCDSVAIDVKPAVNGTFFLEQPTLYGKDYKAIFTKAMVGTPVRIKATPDKDFKFHSVEVNGVTIADTLFLVKEPSTIKVNFKTTLEPTFVLTTTPANQMSFALSAAAKDTEVTVDWGDGLKKKFMLNTGLTRIDGTAAGANVTITGAVSEADFSSFPGMEMWDNKISALEIKNNPDLISLLTYMNDIKTLDVSSCTSLEYLDCSYSGLSELNVANNTKLEELVCYGNTISTLDVTKCPNLIYLDAKGNNLSTLDLSNSKKLVQLDVQNNQLETVNVTEMKDLTVLAVNSNKIASLDLSKNAKLLKLGVAKNKLATLDLTANVALGRLECNDNNIANLDLSNQPDIFFVDCTNNGMSVCALDAMYYSLPDYPQLEEPLKGFTLRVGGNNAYAHAESILATGKGWLINYEGDGTGCPEAFVTIFTPKNGSLKVTDSKGQEVVSGGKVAKNTEITIVATPAEGYKVEFVKANGEVVSNGKFTITRATDVYAKFVELGGVEDVENNGIAIVGGQNEITVNAAVESAVSIYNMAGIELANKVIEGEDVTSLAAGMYIVTVRNNQANVSKVVMVR